MLAKGQIIRTLSRTMAFVAICAFAFILTGAFGRPTDPPIKPDTKVVEKETVQVDISEFGKGEWALPMSGANPEEMSGRFEGDIDMQEKEVMKMFKLRNAMSSQRTKWPNGVVAYVISTSYPASVVTTIQQAMQEITTKTGGCIRFEPKTTHTDYVHIQPKSGCYSTVGRAGGEQLVSIGRGCERKGTIMHELLHALGFFHEQSRSDRDQYVTIDYSNIQSGKDGNFQKYDSSQTVNYARYDYGSVMHYSAYSFAQDRSKPTIIPRDQSMLSVMGQRVRLSEIDVLEVLSRYGCQNSQQGQTLRPTQPPTQPPTLPPNVVPTPMPVVPVITNPPPVTNNILFYCTFDEGTLCGWEVDTSVPHQWYLRSGSTPSYNTGPSSDLSASGQGYYMYLEASGYYNLKARIISPYITATNGEYCVDFYYHMYGDYMGTMNIGVRYDYNTYPVWQKWGDQGNMWRRMRLTARVSGYGTYNLYIEGEVGRSHTSDMAIDNLVVYQGAC